MGKAVMNDKQVKIWMEGGIHDMFECIDIWTEIEINNRKQKC
jgi:hypothetical protein